MVTTISSVTISFFLYLFIQSVQSGNPEDKDTKEVRTMIFENLELPDYQVKFTTKNSYQTKVDSHIEFYIESDTYTGITDKLIYVEEIAKSDFVFTTKDEGFNRQQIVNYICAYQDQKSKDGAFLEYSKDQLERYSALPNKCIFRLIFDETKKFTLPQITAKKQKRKNKQLDTVHIFKNVAHGTKDLFTLIKDLYYGEGYDVMGNDLKELSAEPDRRRGEEFYVFKRKDQLFLCICQDKQGIQDFYVCWIEIKEPYMYPDHCVFERVSPKPSPRPTPNPLPKPLLLPPIRRRTI